MSKKRRHLILAAMCSDHNSDRVSRKPNHVRGVGYANHADIRSSSNMVFNLEQLLRDYADVFEDSGFNSVDGDQVVRVDIDYDQLVAPPYYQVSLNLQEAVMDEIRRLESIGVLRKQFSEFRSPIVAVKKKSGSIRICGDFRALNKAVRDNMYQMPNIFHIAARIKGRIFSNIDLKEAFFNLAIDNESQRFIAIMGPDNKSYVYQRMPFGIKTAPQLFQCYLERLLDA